VKEFFKDNRTAGYLAALTLAVFAVLAALQGCDLRSRIVVKAPKDVMVAIDVDPPMTLAESQAAWEDWVAWVDSRTRQFQRAIGDAEDRYSRIETLIDMGIGAASEAAGGIPGGAFLVGGLSLLTGLVLKRPGEDKRVSGEKEDSYNAGLEEGKRLILAAIKGEKPEEPKT
jgi:hypothetical protein